MEQMKYYVTKIQNREDSMNIEYDTTVPVRYASAQKQYGRCPGP